jgi:hypothetical protein
MSEELWLAALAREWAVRQLPGDQGTANEAASVAVRAYAAGASFSEAYARGQQFVAGRSRKWSQERARSTERRRPLAPPPTLDRPRAADRSADWSR